MFILQILKTHPLYVAASPIHISFGLLLTPFSGTIHSVFWITTQASRLNRTLENGQGPKLPGSCVYVGSDPLLDHSMAQSTLRPDSREYPAGWVCATFRSVIISCQNTQWGNPRCGLTHLGQKTTTGSPLTFSFCSHFYRVFDLRGGEGQKQPGGLLCWASGRSRNMVEPSPPPVAQLLSI